MPVIQNYSDKHNPKILLLSAFYVLLAALALVSLYNFIFESDTNQQQDMNGAVANRNICFEKDVEQYIVDKVDEWTVENEDYKTVEVTSATECNVVIQRNTQDPNNLVKLFDTTYVLVGIPGEQENQLPTSITSQELLDALVKQSLGTYKVAWNLETDSFLRSNFNIGVGQIILSDDEIAKRLVERDYLAIVNLTEITEEMEIVSVESQNPTLEGYNSAKYPLIDRYWIGGNNEGDIANIYGILVEQSETQE